VCVFCGSGSGADPAYREAAALGQEVARRGLRLVYGGGNVGLMGVLADAALAAGGEVVGVIPRALEAREVAHRDLTELVVVGTMHDRKARMVETLRSIRRIRETTFDCRTSRHFANCANTATGPAKSSTAFWLAG
jgi:uncharacterized protein (TIGR00730 family)